VSSLTHHTNYAILHNNMGYCVRIQILHLMMLLSDWICCLVLKWVVWLYSPFALSGYHFTYFISVMGSAHGKPVGFYKDNHYLV
jgi:hypothetical protein